jgi:hypothetical protein
MRHLIVLSRFAKKRRRTMKRLSVLLMLCSLALVSAMAQSPPLKCDMEVYFFEQNPIWRGTVSGDLSGQIFFTNVGTGKRGNQEPGLTIPFEEIWEITDAQGNMLLTGTDRGVVTLANSAYRMNGEVTDAAPGYSHLLGRTVHVSGYITWDPDTGAPLTAPGIFQVN